MTRTYDHDTLVSDYEKMSKLVVKLNTERLELVECLELLLGASDLPDTAYVDYLVQRIDMVIKEAKGL